jgi:hypothetical protein
VVDGFAVFITGLLLLAALAVSMLSYAYLNSGKTQGEYYIC